MTVLYLGGGLDSLNNNTSAVYESADSNKHDIAFTRQGTVVGGEVSAYAEATGWTAVQDLWVHFHLMNAPGEDSDWAYLMDSGVAAFKLHKTVDGLRMSYLSAPSTWTLIGDPIPVGNIAHDYDIHLVTGASGSATLFIDGVEQTTDTASITYSPDIDNVRFLSAFNGLELPGVLVSQICVADEVTVGGRVVQGYMTSDGASTAFTGTYADVDEAELNESDYIYSATADQVETYGYTLVGSVSGYTPKAFCVSARAKRGSTGPQNIQLALRSGSTTYFSATKALGLGYTAVQNVWNTNPDTSAAFTAGQLAALQPGVKSIT